MSKTETKVGFIISTFNRPEQLRVALASLAAQSIKEIEVWVADNSNDSEARRRNHGLVAEQDRRFHYVHTAKSDWCRAANQVAPMVKAHWIGFPTDDAYYPPLWVEAMLTRVPGADLRMSDCQSDSLGSAWYHIIPAYPKLGGVVKGGFLVRRELFKKFFIGPQAAAVADALLVEELVGKGVRWGKALGMIWILN